MKVWVAHATTESFDHYLFAYAYRPTEDAVIKRVWEKEKAAPLKFYKSTTSVQIEETELTKPAVEPKEK